jgi:hypothetical protein
MFGLAGRKEESNSKGKKQKKKVVTGRVLAIPPIAKCAMDGAPGRLWPAEEDGNSRGKSNRRSFDYVVRKVRVRLRSG